MEEYDYFLEIDRQRYLNTLFCKSKIIQFKFDDYLKNLNKSHINIEKKKRIINDLIPKIKKYSLKIHNFKKINNIY